MTFTLELIKHYVLFILIMNLYTEVLKVIAHWVRHFQTLKNKYDVMLCQSRLHIASETFVHQNKFGPGLIFSVFVSVALFW